MKGKKLITIISIVCILAVMLCVSAFATVTESDGNGYALFNGIKLPEISSLDVDLTTYPYALIYKTTATSDGVPRYFVIYSTTEFTYSSLFFRSDGSVIRYRYLSTGSAWDVTTVPSTVAIPANQFIWVNHDVYNTSDDSIYVSASTSISLDGYNIIEWDGDTTELVSDPDVGYRLASYEYAVDAFAVWNGDTRSVQSTYVGQSPIWVVQSSGATGVADGSGIVAGNDGTDISGFSFNGIYAYKTSDYYPSLIAYRTTETPPDEGGGDDPDDPQPPFGVVDI